MAVPFLPQPCGRPGAADDAAREALIRAHAAERAKDQAMAGLEDLIAADTGDDSAVWTEGDIKWLNR